MKTTTFGPVRRGTYQGRRLIVQTARSAGHERNYGYVIRFDPPITHKQEGIDVEGVGYWRWPGGPKTITRRFLGWYKTKALALQRAREHTA